MALKITNNQGIFEIKGSIVRENASSLKRHFEQLLHTSDKVILCVDKVKKIDVTGVNVLTTLFKNAMKNNKVFFVIGKENEKVRKAFGDCSYVLRNDFV
ncbi:STAS domain-containing protein [Aquimarina sp. AU474]|uniref:STAS domain-containing protein n=1 Tax=Aquimarina sp. AU474 TaxID=2108529 RepID=UPI000D693226|nr:STAS domain-containing protein [Aquimarina sp. AU474]